MAQTRHAFDRGVRSGCICVGVRRHCHLGDRPAAATAATVVVAVWISVLDDGIRSCECECECEYVAVAGLCRLGVLLVSSNGAADFT